MPKRYGYRHKTISQFSVNHDNHEFTFKNGMLIIMAPPSGDEEADDARTESLNNSFLAAVGGMEPRDRNAITHLKEIENEASVGDAEIAAAQSRAIRGPVQTTDIKAPVKSDNVNGGTGLKLGPTGQVSPAAPPAPAE